MSMPRCWPTAACCGAAGITPTATAAFTSIPVNPDGTDVQLLYGRGSHNTISTNPGGADSCPAGEDCTVQFVQAA